MLDTTTKKRIDDCRDILVGKLPDPKAQIEQITIGLIYKFMDDMDKEAIELGGTAKFFSGSFEKYSWDNLFDTKVTANDMLGLYSEAIASMDKNPNIPQLFRDIFKNAYLPYRDPETLKMFLKTIGEFEYTHSEKLGDAFEYLLSVMGSQGDAGQFRTPRHIIDFLVAIVDPKKTDTILDPACGTAGFLISAFKYIMGGDGKDARPCVSTITPDERRRIISNFTGYDISPDMVRLSLVNLYLHGFSDPHIWEYDTLSSEDRWNETFDVILANPPFMSPKGGIRPHKKFSISSNRSEVLFVDYIAEHLNPKGRAGIIVPEGVIFQSGTAYKDLRKMLVENYLYAVVSLPAGVFNPYSGVKTSILLMDKEFAKTSNEILFVKIDNDGYGLGAQRNAVKGGQLDEAIAVIRSFVNNQGGNTNHCPTDGATVQTHGNDEMNGHDEMGGNDETRGNDEMDGHDETRGHVETHGRASLSITNTAHSVQTHGRASQQPNPQSSIAHIVPKSEIAKNGDYNLSGERYKVTHIHSTEFELITLGELCELFGGGTPSKAEEDYWSDGTIKWLSAKHIDNNGRIIGHELITEEGLKNSSSKIVPKDSLIFITRVSVGKYAYTLDDFAINQDLTGVLPYDRSKLSVKYLYCIANKIAEIIDKQAVGIGVRGITRQQLSEIQIPLPPLSIQEEIVAEIEGYQKIIDGAKMVVENYKPKIDIDADWEMVELGEVCESISDGDHQPPPKSDEGVPFVTISNISKDNNIDFSKTYFVSPIYFDNIKPNRKPKLGDILYTVTGSYGIPVLVDFKKDFCFQRHIGLIRPNFKILNSYLYYYLKTPDALNQADKAATGVAQKTVSLNSLRKFVIPFPPIETQSQIVSRIEKEQELVNANKQLIEIFEQKIKDRIAKVWGE